MNGEYCTHNKQTCVVVGMLKKGSVEYAIIRYLRDQAKHTVPADEVERITNPVSRKFGEDEPFDIDKYL